MMKNMTSRSFARPAFSIAPRPFIVQACTLFMAALALCATQGNAEEFSIEETEAFVRATYFEGMPHSEAERIGPAGLDRLFEMLGDAAEAKSHANILVVLGLCGAPGTFEAITTWASLPRQGEIDRDTFRAWQAIPFAMAHLAKADARAIDALKTRLAGDSPTWTFRHHQGDRLTMLSKRAAATALGMTGLPEAAIALQAARSEANSLEFDAHLKDAQELFAARASANFATP